MLGIEGMSAEAAHNFRDKSRMKNVLRAAGVPCARHRLAHDHAEGRSFAEEVGFPLVLKPPAGAGAQGTFRVDNNEAFEEALSISAPTAHQPVLIEEFITGEEHSLETISIGGRAVWHSLTHYYPTPLEVLRNPWIQWCLLLPREIDGPQYDDIREAAGAALEALGMDSGLSHMEWFRRKDGSVAISEVGARPPGAQITTLVSRAHDIDFLNAWARVMIYGEFEPPERRYAAGAAFLRGQGQGRVVAIHGLEEAGRELGDLVTDVKLPELGQTPTGSYEGEGYVLLRHPETEVVKDALQRLISIVRVELG
jgi:biotin carboxylase